MAVRKHVLNRPSESNRKYIITVDSNGNLVSRPNMAYDEKNSDTPSTAPESSDTRAVSTGLPNKKPSLQEKKLQDKVQECKDIFDYIQNDYSDSVFDYMEENNVDVSFKFFGLNELGAVVYEFEEDDDGEYMSVTEYPNFYEVSLVKGHDSITQSVFEPLGFYDVYSDDVGDGYRYLDDYDY